MKSFTRINIALLYFVSMSLFVMSLGSVLMAAPSGYKLPSPFVGTLSPTFLRGQAYNQIRAKMGMTYADILPASQKVKDGLLPMASGSSDTTSGSSSVQTTDLTLLGYTLGANGLPTAPTGDNVDPFWSVDESTIFFSSTNTSDGHYHIFSMPAGGGTPIQLTMGTGNERYPALSSNGSQIVFCESANATGGPYSLVIAQYNGSAITSTSTVTPNTLDVQHPVFSGSTLFFAARTSATNPYHIYSVTTSGLSLTQITSGPADEENPAVAPTGTVIAFDSNASSYTGDVSQGTVATRDIYVSYFTGQNLEKFTSDNGTTNVDPIFTQTVSNVFLNPNGAHLFIFFSSNRTVSGKFSIYYLRATPTANPLTSGPVIDTEGTNNEVDQFNQHIGANVAVEVDTSDPTNQFDNLEPAVSSMQTFVQVAYASKRYIVNGPNDNPLTPSGTIYDAADLAAVTPQIDVEPVNTATNPATSDEILSSRLVDIDPPSLLRYNNGTGEIIHVFQGPISGLAASNGAVNHNISPGSQVTFVVRLSDRQTGDGQAYIQIKDPNSKYQDAASLEHKLYTSEFGTGETSTLYDAGNAGIAGFSGQNPIKIGYLNGNNFVPEGEEVDCQAISATSSDATNPADFSTPVYTPSSEDAVFLSGGGNPPENTIWLKLQPLPQVDQDGNGGVLYSASWTTPQTPSDWYLDVIAYDNAEWPIPYNLGTGFEGQNTNWRIYDNVWGFTTAPFPTNGQHGVLVVSDYALPQKFFDNHFGALNPGLAIPPNFFGAESYVTDIDVVEADGGVSDKAVAPYEAQMPTGNGTINEAILQPAGVYFPTAYANGLGVNSYNDATNEHGSIVDGAEYPVSQQYDIWRILARGPIPQQTLDAYAPAVETEPLPTDPTKTQPVEVANACVLWISPVASDEFAGPGTITDGATQTEIDNFLKLGGRIFVSGIDVGFALTSNGSLSKGSPGFDFYTNDLLATYQADGTGFTPAVATVTGAGAMTDYISHDAFFNNNAPDNIVHNSMLMETQTGPVYQPPNSEDITLANDNFGLSFMQSQVDRNDSSLNTYAPGAGLHGFIDAISPTLSEALEPVELTAAGPFGTARLFYNIGTPNAQTPYLTNIMAYGSFGLEAISQEMYPFGNTPSAYVREQRTDLIHNMICFMRTGRLTGQVINSSNGGQGEPNVVVSAQLANIGGPVYTALTDNQGRYTIQGLTPGFYIVNGFKADFTIQHQQTSPLLHGGDFAAVNALIVNPTQPGVLTVTVEDASTNNPIQGVAVTATPVAGGTPLTGTTDATGKLVFDNVAAGQYNVTANGAAVGYGTGADPNNPITVPAGGNATSLIKLSPGPATVYGLVNNLPNGDTANVSVVNAQGHVVASGTTVAQFNITNNNGQGFDGGAANYEIQNVPAGTYSVVVSLVGFVATPVQAQPFTVAGGHGHREDFNLATAQNAHVLGLVTDNNGNPITGATVTFTDANNVPHTVTTTAPVTAATAIDGQTQFNYGLAADGTTENFQLLQGSYTAQATAQGLSPTPVITVQVVSDPTVQNFQGANGLQTLHTFQSGLTLFSVPFDYSQTNMTLQEIFGYPDPTLAVWNTAISQYAITPTPPANTITLGQGYWARFPATEVLAPGGTPAPTINPFTITLKPGWNMIGDPFMGSANLAGIQVVNTGGTSFSWTNATGPNLHMVNPTLYSYDMGTNQYDQHYVGSTVGKQTDLNPTLDTYVGYWVEAFTTCALQISPPPAAPIGLGASVTTSNNKPAVQLTWTAVPGATSYNVYRSTSSGAETLLQAGVAGTTFTDTTVVHTTTYFYEVAAVNAGGISLFSNEASASP